MCTMTFVYEEGFCTDEADKRLLAVTSHFSYLAENMQQHDFCVVGKYVTKCFCKQTGCNVHVRQILPLLATITGRQAHDFAERNKQFLRVDDEEAVKIANCLYHEFSRSASGDVALRRVKRTSEGEEIKEENAGDDLASSIALAVGTLFSFAMLLASYFVFTNMEDDRDALFCGEIAPGGAESQEPPEPEQPVTAAVAAQPATPVPPAAPDPATPAHPPDPAAPAQPPPAATTPARHDPEYEPLTPLTSGMPPNITKAYKEQRKRELKTKIASVKKKRKAKGGKRRSRKQSKPSRPKKPTKRKEKRKK